MLLEYVDFSCTYKDNGLITNRLIPKSREIKNSFSVIIKIKIKNEE